MPFLRSVTKFLLNELNHCPQRLQSLPASSRRLFFFLSYPRSIGTATAALISPCLFPSFFFFFSSGSCTPKWKETPRWTAQLVLPITNTRRTIFHRGGWGVGLYTWEAAWNKCTLSFCKGQWVSGPLQSGLHHQWIHRCKVDKSYY